MDKFRYTVKDSITDLMIGLVFTLFFLSVGVVLILNFRPLYYFDISLLNITESSSLSDTVIRENYDVLMDYNSPFFEGDLKFPTLEASDTGLQHFAEVKQIFVSFYYLLAISGVVLIPFIIYKAKRDVTLRFLRSSSAMILILPLVVGSGFAIDFDKSFVVFHKIFFDNDYWIFSPETDPVITILPDTFFLQCAVGIIGIMFLGSIVLYLLYKRKQFRS